MRIERYAREYYYDETDNNYGLYLSNDGYHLGGDVNLPGFKPYDIASSDVDKILQMIEVEFGTWNEESPEYHYVTYGLRQLLLGQKSDWKITLIEPLPGGIYFYLRNRKIAKAQDVLDELDTGEKFNPAQIATLDFSDGLRGWTIVKLVPRDGEYCHLKISLKRKDFKKEVDFYDIMVWEKTAKITESHRISRSKCEINLCFGDKVDEYNNAEVMIADIEEVK